MKKPPVALAEEYYTWVGAKNLEKIKTYLHPDVELHGPLSHVKGKEAVVKATGDYLNVFQSLTIRSKFGSENQAMIVYEADIPGIAKDFPAAVLLSFRDGLIVKSELFFDASRFRQR
jgi:ketosteroid isomerase-like protein